MIELKDCYAVFFYMLTNYIYSDKIYIVILCIQRGGLQNENQ